MSSGSFEPRPFTNASEDRKPKARKGTVSDTKAVESQGKGTALAMTVLETQGKGAVLATKAVSHREQSSRTTRDRHIDGAARPDGDLRPKRAVRTAGSQAGLGSWS